jgi:hypothetical protein
MSKSNGWVFTFTKNNGDDLGTGTESDGTSLRADSDTFGLGRAIELWHARSFCLKSRQSNKKTWDKPLRWFLCLGASLWQFQIKLKSGLMDL